MWSLCHSAVEMRLVSLAEGTVIKTVWFVAQVFLVRKVALLPSRQGPEGLSQLGHIKDSSVLTSTALSFLESMLKMQIKQKWAQKECMAKVGFLRVTGHPTLCRQRLTGKLSFCMHNFLFQPVWLWPVLMIKFSQCDCEVLFCFVF